MGQATLGITSGETCPPASEINSEATWTKEKHGQDQDVRGRGAMVSGGSTELRSSAQSCLLTLPSTRSPGCQSQPARKPGLLPPKLNGARLRTSSNAALPPTRCVTWQGPCGLLSPSPPLWEMAEERLRDRVSCEPRDA